MLASGVDLSRYVLVCVALGVLLALGLWLLRRGVAGTLRRRAARRSLGVLDVLPLGRNKRLVVVRCYDRSFLIGVGEKELSCMAELERAEPEGPSEVPAAVSGAPREDFAAALAREVVPAPPKDPAEVARQLLRGGLLG